MAVTCEICIDTMSRHVFLSELISARGRKKKQIRTHVGPITLKIHDGDDVIRPNTLVMAVCEELIGCPLSNFNQEKRNEKQKKSRPHQTGTGTEDFGDLRLN